MMITAASLAAASIDLEVRIEDQLKHFSDIRFPGAKHADSWLKAREHVKNMFEEFGLEVETQRFTTTVLTAEGEAREVEGANIIGIARASTHRTGGVVVVGADYDTSAHGEPSPLFNNGAGVGALLETARLFAKNVDPMGGLGLDRTTVFVAFDLNTKEHMSGPGKPGGWYFVNEWLWEFLNYSDAAFGGAFVLDSLMNMFPDTHSRIVQSNNRGNFLAVVSLPGEKTSKLKDRFEGNYNESERTVPPPGLPSPPTPPSSFPVTLFRLTTKTRALLVLRQRESDTLPALLVTDTENLRHAPSPPCQDPECPLEDWLTEERHAFLVSTVKALVSTLLKRQAHQLSAKVEPLSTRGSETSSQEAGAYEMARKVTPREDDKLWGSTAPKWFESIGGGAGRGSVAQGRAAGGPVLVVGADYDTGAHGSPLEDNGAGVAVLLEVARLFVQQTGVGGAFEQLGSVVFVAFDGNTKEYGTSHPGKQGSYHFLHQWLWNYLGQSADRFGGAIIIDSIARYSEVDDSQYVSEDFVAAFPDASRDIAKNHNRANFLAVFAREDNSSHQLAKAFSKNYERDTANNPITPITSIHPQGPPRSLRQDTRFA
ncbi:hypothetical protein C7M84_005839 [Penaeus vannamei]|uniref:Peptidase M28 domain-containing protein n=1 Tax=Penaeus vannamei TaxID=6689 RepID=A0A423TGM8_PENVA|nr:hypothetical protein C7M84_005839 [Penaeus vannamei]